MLIPMEKAYWYSFLWWFVRCRLTLFVLTAYITAATYYEAESCRRQSSYILEKLFGH